MKNFMLRHWYLILLLPWVMGFLFSAGRSLFSIDEVTVSKTANIASQEKAVISTTYGPRGNSSSYDTTDTHIYFLYTERASCVDVFDHNGNFQFSLHFSSRENGSMFIRCHDGYLYVSTKYGNVFVFDGEQQIACFSEADAKLKGFDVHWFTSRDNTTKLGWGTMSVYHSDGNLTSTIKVPIAVFVREIYGVIIFSACVLVIFIQMMRKQLYKRKNSIQFLI